jgi:tRNA-binding protein
VEAHDRLRLGDRHQALVGADHPLPALSARGRLVVGVVNFPPKRIGPFLSEALVMGALDEEKGVVLLRPDEDVELGDRIA